MSPRETNLPAAMEPLIGRTDELAWLRERLRAGYPRLITLTGPGGSGKTRLALEAGGDVIAEFPGGVWLVEFGGLSDPSLVVGAIAAVVEVRDASPVSLVDRLTRALAVRRLLLVLDNFEHLLPAAAQVGALLAACPHLQVLATSRVPLHLRGEQEFAVEPLALPPADARSAAAVVGAPAAELFVRRAGAVSPDFVLDDAAAGEVAAICRRLDGLPLAIELAAARMKMLPPTVLRHRLERRLDVLADGPRDAPARQRSLRATVDWSYRLLAQDEQWLLRQLAAFPGGCELAVLERVFSTSAARPVLDCLAALMDAGLLRREGQDEEPRVTMLQTIRDRALELLDEHGERDDAERRQAQQLFALAREAATHLLGAQQPEWLERLEREHDNLRAALAWSLRSPGALEAGLRAAGSLLPFWWIGGHFGEAREWLERALEDLDVGPSVRAPGLLAAGMLAILQGDGDAAQRALSECDRLATAAGDRFSRAWALAGLALLAGDPDSGEALARESVAVFDAAGSTWGVAYALDTLAMLTLGRGNAAEAVRLLESALPRFRDLGERRGIAIVLLHLANALGVGDPDSAERRQELLRESLMLSAGLRDRDATARALDAFAALAADRGDWRRAARLVGASDRLREAIGAIDRMFDTELAPRIAGGAPDRTRFEREWEAGRALKLEQAVAYALRTDSAELQADGGLTPREAEVLRLLAQGLSNREIAEALVVSVKTVERHLANIYPKIGARGRVEAAVYALRHESA